MSSFLNISPQKSKGIHEAIYKNARKLKQDATLIAEVNKSYSTATSLLILSSEEIVKAILVLLHSEGFDTYRMENAKRFFSDHKIRHQLAKLLELSAGLFEAFEKYDTQEPAMLFNTKYEWLNDTMNCLIDFKNAAVPFIESVNRTNELESFNDLKNQGFYVDYRDSLLIPEIVIGEYSYNKTRMIVDRIFRVYKFFNILFHPSLKRHYNLNEIENFKNDLQAIMKLTVAEI
ncbi:MAG: hypothetical protein CFE23_09315 [Flavobacterium sp. BFFFF1]|uniref:AbiV family abortive infection protein n=1 Tax=Flavobacterium sp. BFFFF1 TaxID=2015557 RepID=UPI000BDA95A8|nr:AbiV family abortive infection protein [Flavobacterium sp. BFFFF1]OYU80445.1 MAG: hypothetical protein CFE23_09315 [Flavobacterium sp. BFFFF1]